MGRPRTFIVAAVLISATLATAAPAHAAFLDVNFTPNLGGVEVNVVDTNGAGDQACSYDATSLGGLGGLVPPTHRDFTLPRKGSTTLQLPGIMTGTRWHVVINCTLINSVVSGGSSGGIGNNPGNFDATVTY